MLSVGDEVGALAVDMEVCCSAALCAMWALKSLIHIACERRGVPER